MTPRACGAVRYVKTLEEVVKTLRPTWRVLAVGPWALGQGNWKPSTRKKDGVLIAQ